MRTYNYKGVEVSYETGRDPRLGLGGQSCGLMYTGVTLNCEIIDITINAHRSQMKNFEFGRQLMELAIDEVIK
jgi:hypothetical protein